MSAGSCPEGRYWTPIERIPVFLQKALVAVEDARFYEHGGIDVRGIARALVKDVVKGKLAEGGLDHHPAADQEQVSLRRKDHRPETQGRDHGG